MYFGPLWNALPARPCLETCSCFHDEKPWPPRRPQARSHQVASHTAPTPIHSSTSTFHPKANRARSVDAHRDCGPGVAHRCNCFAEGCRIIVAQKLSAGGNCMPLSDFEAIWRVLQFQQRKTEWLSKKGIDFYAMPKAMFGE